MKFEINVPDDVVDRVKPLLQLRRPIPPEIPPDDPFRRRKVIFVNVQTFEEMNEYIEKFINNRFECLIEDKIEKDKSIYIKDIPYELNNIKNNLEYITELLELVETNTSKNEGYDDE